MAASWAEAPWIDDMRAEAAMARREAEDDRFDYYDGPDEPDFDVDGPDEPDGDTEVEIVCPRCAGDGCPACAAAGTVAAVAA